MKPAPTERKPRRIDQRPPEPPLATASLFRQTDARLFGDPLPQVIQPHQLRLHFAQLDGHRRQVVAHVLVGSAGGCCTDSTNSAMNGRLKRAPTQEKRNEVTNDSTTKAKPTASSRRGVTFSCLAVAGAIGDENNMRCFLPGQCRILSNTTSEATDGAGRLMAHARLLVKLVSGSIGKLPRRTFSRPVRYWRRFP